MRVHFSKYNCAGNDFIIINNNAWSDPHANGVGNTAPSTSFEHPIQRHVSSLCHRHKGIGADGLIVLQIGDTNTAQIDFSAQYYNADASTGLCANGSCCAAHAAAHILNKAHLCFQLNDTLLEATVAQDEAVLLWQTTGGIEVFEDGYFINESAAHFVQFVKQMPQQITEKGRILRQDTRFAHGANISFVEHSPQGLVVRTYERGVEAETLACGTGAVAVVRAAYDAHIIRRPHAQVIYTGGTLHVELQAPYEQPKVKLRSPIHLVYQGCIDIPIH